MSAWEAALLPAEAHAMVDPDPLEAAFGDPWIRRRCRGCGEVEDEPYLDPVSEVLALEAVRAWRHPSELAPS